LDIALSKTPPFSSTRPIQRRHLQTAAATPRVLRSTYALPYAFFYPRYKFGYSLVCPSPALIFTALNLSTT
jgi:hypothetical protein